MNFIKDFIESFFIRVLLSIISLIFIGLFFIVDTYIYPDSCGGMLFTPILLLAYATLFFSIVSIMMQVIFIIIRYYSEKD